VIDKVLGEVQTAMRKIKLSLDVAAEKNFDDRCPKGKESKLIEIQKSIATKGRGQDSGSGSGGKRESMSAYEYYLHWHV
jgi:hypothetical protein